MGTINWIGRSAVGVLSLPFLGSTALAQEDADIGKRFPMVAQAEDPGQHTIRHTPSGGAPLRRDPRSGMLDWGTGGFELRGERLRSGSKSTDAVDLHSRWQRTYVAEVGFWENAVPGTTFAFGARIERTTSGVARGPLLTKPTSSVTQMAYVGAQISESSTIRLVAFDNGGWSERATEELASRIANGEPAARKGAAIGIGRFDLRPANASRKPQLKLRVGRGRTAGRSVASAAVFWQVGF